MSLVLAYDADRDAVEGVVVGPARTVAEARAERIRCNVAALVADLVDAWRERDDEALGFATFGEYLAWLFGDARAVALPVDARRELVAGMVVRDDLSTREIARQLGESQSTIARDRKAMLGEPGPAVQDEGAPAVGDAAGAPAPVEQLETEPAPVWVQALEALRTFGATGATRLELAAALGWTEGRVGGVLVRLRRKRVALEGADRRESYTVWRAAEVVR